jgi:hypothetical protein
LHQLHNPTSNPSWHHYTAAWHHSAQPGHMEGHMLGHMVLFSILFFFSSIQVTWVHSLITCMHSHSQLMTALPCKEYRDPYPATELGYVAR